MSAFRDDAWPSKHRTGQPSELHVYSSLGQQVLRPVDFSGQFGDDTRDPACLHDTCIRPQRSDTSQGHLPANTRHSTNAVSMLASVSVAGPALKRIR